MKKEGWLTIVLLFIVWLFVGMRIDNSIWLPKVDEVLWAMFLLVQDSSFFQAIQATFFRMLNGLVLSFLPALLLGLLQIPFPRLKDYFSPLASITKTIPTISYIILCLIWLGQEGSVRAIVFFVLFPIFYSNISLGIDQFHKKTDELLKIYPITPLEKSIKLALPMLLPYLIQGIRLAIGMGFKVAIVAEIMAATQPGIGRSMHFCRLNLDTAGIFAWTIWVVLICMLLDTCFSWIIKRFYSENQ